jgi:hypothetical protein
MIELAMKTNTAETRIGSQSAVNAVMSRPPDESFAT